MEEWEIELEYLTFEALDKKSADEVLEVDEETFQADLEEMYSNPNEWEDVTHGS